MLAEEVASSGGTDLQVRQPVRALGAHFRRRFESFFSVISSDWTSLYLYWTLATKESRGAAFVRGAGV